MSLGGARHHLRDVDVDGVQVLTRYLSGLDAYFPKTGA